MAGAEHISGFFIELFRIVTGTGLYKEQMDLKVQRRPLVQLSLLLDKIRGEMEDIMNQKTAAVEQLKKAAEQEMKNYGPYQHDINFEDVSYFNAKKVVINSDFDIMTNDTQKNIKSNINYLATEPTWDFKNKKSRPQLNVQTSSIHVPTNIYDKSMKILNGVKWTRNMTKEFVNNRAKDPSLTWQYFCSSDGFFRIYPGMQWPRDADKVDTFDCRIRQWYIQAATSPKNLIILLDSSGSMKGLRFSIAKSTVNTILDTLSDEDYFNVIQFSDEPKYVVDCFNGTLMPASVDNIKRVETNIEDLKAKKFANFEKALTTAFHLFRKETYHHQGQICNKAIMLITDGAPDNFDYIFKSFNWPHKKVRLFTFLIGKEVQDNRQARWMACANKGKFTHISTRADVQENVQKYVKVLSRPLAIHQARHKVWTPVYLDYVTLQGDILAKPGKHTQLEVDYEKDFSYQGLGLVMSVSMPVFDKRSPDRVGPTEEEPSRNLLGVVGADLRVNELMKFLPTFKLGVNGYAFAITNHGYILFHPDYKPFYTQQKFKLKPRPKYNSVELSEVERPATLSRNEHMEHPLSHYLLTLATGDIEFTAITHFDNMKRVEKRKNLYKFVEVSEMFRLVFVVPDEYGSRFIECTQSHNDLWREYNKTTLDHDQTTLQLSSWIYCHSLTENGYDQIWTMTHHYIRQDRFFKYCDEHHAQHILKDIIITLKYAWVWQGYKSYHVRANYVNKYVKDYDDCYANAYNKNRLTKLKCFLLKHNMQYGINIIWIGTHSGVTRYLNMDMAGLNKRWEQENTETIKSSYYQRTVSLWNAGYDYVFTGPVSSLQKEFEFNTSIITLSHVEVVGDNPKMQVPAAVVAFSMKYSAFYDVFVRYTFDCQKDVCFYTCNDTDHFSCYILDNNGYILASNNPDKNGTSLFLGQHDGYLMRALIDDNIYEEIQLTDFQSICETRILSGQDNASNFIINPLQVISKVLVWLFTEIIFLFSQLTVMTWHGISGVVGLENTVNVGDEKECGEWIPEPYARYLFCGFVINMATGERKGANFVTKMRSCEQKVTRYNLNLEALQRRKTANSIAPCHLQCQENQPSYEVKRLNKTNMVFIVADASCLCNRSTSPVHEEEEEEEEEEVEEGDEELVKKAKNRYVFSIKPEEKTYLENEQCQRLRNLSEELKRVDKTRSTNTLCLDSSNEEDTTCSHSSTPTLGVELCIGMVLLSVLQLWIAGSNVQ